MGKLALAIPGLALSVISGLLYNLYLWLQTNAAGVFGVWVALAGVFYMIGFKKLAKLTLPFFLVLTIILTIK